MRQSGGKPLRPPGDSSGPLPRRRGEADPARLFETEEYLVEIRVPAENRWAGRSLKELGEEVGGSLIVLGSSAGVVGSRSPRRSAGGGKATCSWWRRIRTTSGGALSDTDLEAAGTRELREHFLNAEDVGTAEAVVQPDTRAVGKIARELALRSRYRVNLLGVARHGERVRGRIGKVALRPGDVLLLQGGARDPFLMAIAVGASSAFLTPIGHQSNTLVMGPGGYRFGDYLYLGLPVSALVVALAVPLILVVWPL